MRRLIRRFCVANFIVGAVGFCALASAAQFSCNVRLGTVLVYGDGFVNVLHSGRGDYTYVCNLNTPWNGVSVQSCAMWTSLLLKLKGEGKNALFSYYGGDNVTCANMGVYSNAPAPIYIGMLDEPAAKSSSESAKLPILPPES